ncbi:hypothetical protein D3C80_2101080 [compost metagenome]
MLKRIDERPDGTFSVHDDGVVGLYELATPSEVRGAADSCLDVFAIDHDGLVMLEVTHVLAFDLVSSSGRGEEIGSL